MLGKGGIRLGRCRGSAAAVGLEPVTTSGRPTQKAHRRPVGHRNRDRQEQTRLTITSTHAKSADIQAILANLASFLCSLETTAEQLTDAQRLRAILTRAFAQFMPATADPTAGLTTSFAEPG